MTNPTDKLEAAIVSAGANVARRITPADIAANIASEHYFTASQALVGETRGPEWQATPKELDLLTFCVLVLRNGFTVTGESACARPENFNAEIGRRIARENAVTKVWPLMGYELRTHIHEAAVPANHQDRVEIERHELNQKIQKLTAFLSTDTFAQLPEGERNRLTEQQAAMLDYYGCLLERIRAFSAKGD